MLVNHRYRFLFVHIPKTSGAAFREYNKKHLTSWWRRNWEEVRGAHEGLTPEIAERYKDYFKFTIVRNPWRLIASGYRFDTQGVRRDKEGLLQKRDVSVLDWLEERIKDDRYGPFPCQLDYISHDGKLLVDQCCRQENLSKEIQEVLNKLGAPYQEKDWVAPKRHYYGDYDWKEYFSDPRVQERVKNVCRKDFEFFGWDSNFESYR
jgi:chondroitin 4-sulfotransferase 11